MQLDDILNLDVPFKVRSVRRPRNTAIVTGFSQNDPLGVGGGLLPDMPTAYFEGGGVIIATENEAEAVTELLKGMD